ncbi:hypothetical protein HYX10_06295 [Candidatus Woesearchaeota archaeon]|nr:hypothetical protein [Candidatus Woesearchaeota archaeon]
MFKKAQGLPLSTMVIAAVVLIVLIILVGIFTGYFGKFVPGLEAATERTCLGAGISSDKAECDPETERQIFGNFGSSVPPGNVCCKSLICGDLGGACVVPGSGKCAIEEIKDGTAYCQRSVSADTLCCG